MKERERIRDCHCAWLGERKANKHGKRKARMDLPNEKKREREGEKSINDIHEQGGLRGHVREKERP